MALLLAGCAQIAGIDETSGPAADAPTETDRVQLAFERISVGTEIVRSPLDLTAQTASYLVSTAGAPDGLERVTPVVEGSTWVSDLTTPTPIEFTLPDLPTPVTRIWDLNARALTGGYTFYEHPNPTAPPDGATLAMAVTSDVAFTGAESYQLYTVGAWTIRDLLPPAAAAAALDATPFLYTETASIGGRPHIALTMGDPLFVMRYAGNQLMALAEPPPFDQTGADTLGGALVAVAQDQMLDLTFDYATTAARFTVVSPAVTPAAAAWFLRAAPGAAIGSDVGPLLHAVGVNAATVNPIAAAYANPFIGKGWPTVMTLVANASRSYTPPSLGFELGLNTQLLQVGPPGGAATFAAALPTRIAINGTLLTIDGVEVARPTLPAEVTFQSTTSEATYYALNLYEVVLNAASTGVTRNLVVQIVSDEQRFTMPAEYLQGDKLYNLRILVHQGFASGAATGDLRPDSGGSRALHDSGVFKVVP